MKLFYSASSPFSRKCRIVLREKGLAALVTEIEVNPFNDPPLLRQHNRLGLVPTLVAGNLPLYDSKVICDYLDSRHETPRLIPQAGADRWRVLRAQALADGLLDIAVGMVVERRRPPQEQSPAAQQRWRQQMLGALDAMEEQVADLSGILNLGHIAFAAALGYLDFRYADLDWRRRHAQLATWFDPFSQRPAMLQTAPSDSSYKLPVPQKA
jgi:glutathione S-transferase